MPQMNPTWWLTLFFMFIFILSTTNPLIYFNKNITLKTSQTSKKAKMLTNWKW